MLPLKYVIAGGAALALISYVGWSVMYIRTLNANLELAETLRDAETKRADQNAASFNAYLAAEEHNNQIAEQVAAQRATIDVLVRQTQESIANAPASDDAPIAPVMLDALDGLRRIFDAAHGDPIRAPADPARIAELQGRHTASADDDAKPAGGMAHAGSGERLGVPAGSGPIGRSSVIARWPVFRYDPRETINAVGYAEQPQADHDAGEDDGKQKRQEFHDHTPTKY